MNEIRIANYTLLAVLLIVMATFYASINALSQSNKIEEHTPVFYGHIY